MREVDEVHVWIGVGLLGSLLLGIALMPLRSLTSASNLAFVFLALTIIVAEQGGRLASLVTAIGSAVSLNFFLTEPYFRLTIDKPDDVVAFLALAACGLIAAAFGTRRGRWSEVARQAGDDLNVVRTLVWQLRNGAPLDEILELLRHSFGLRAIALRSPDERILATAGADGAPLPIPEARLDPDSFMPLEHGQVLFGAKGVRVPPAGGRLRLRSNAGFIVLDLWEGSTEGLGAHEVRALSIAASVLALEVSHRQAA